eukprot:03961.XXX_132492_128891_1 [CDS] Oithona nana genome sequencing.
MPATKRNKNGPVTRSQKTSDKLDITTYTTLNAKPDKPIQVVSKRGLKSNPKVYEELEKKFERIEAKRKQQEAEQNEGLKTETLHISPEIWDRRNTIFFITHFNVFLYATCFFIQVGTLPYLSKKLGADPTTFGQLQTVFAVAQLMGGPFFGRAGDTFGEKFALILAFTGAMLSYLLMGVADSIAILFLSRLPSVVMHTMQGSQMIVTYLSEESERANVLARLGFSYGIGMVVGPILGGYITSYFNEQTSSLLAACGSLLSVILVLLFIPHIPKNQELKKRKASPSNENQSKGFLQNIAVIGKLFFLPGVGILLVVKLVGGIPIGILQSMFSLIAIDQFGMKPEQNGMMLSYIGIISLFMQGIGIATLTKMASDKVLMLLSTMTLMGAYFVLTLISQVWDFLMLLFPLTCSLCLINAIVTAAITKAVSRSDTGTVLGLNMAVHSAIRSFAPTIGGFIVQTYGFPSLGLIGVGCNAIVLLLIKVAPFKETVE